VITCAGPGSILLTPRQLEFLVRQAGASHVVLGTDFPFDLGANDPIDRLNAAEGLSDQDRAAIRGLNAARLLGIEDLS